MAEGAAPFTAFRFHVLIDVENGTQHGLSGPLCEASFSECSGLEATMEQKTMREGGNNAEQIQLPGPVSYGQLSLKRGMTSNLDLWRWFSALTLGGKTGIRANAQVWMEDAAGRPTATFRLSDCLPVKLKAPTLAAKDTAIAIEELSIAYGRFWIDGWERGGG